VFMARPFRNRINSVVSKRGIYTVLISVLP